MSLPFEYTAIFNIKSELEFNELACLTFQHQYQNNLIYQGFVDQLKINPNQVKSYKSIPFLPISFFKTHEVVTGQKPTETIFYSSGTTGENRSKHHVTDLTVYDAALLNGFEFAFGKISDYALFALLPSYHDNKNSSLLYMVSKLQKFSGNFGGFYLDNYTQLLTDIAAQKKNNKIILMGVSYALLDLAELFAPDLSDIIVLETGGMKGRRKEMTKEDLHGFLKQGLHCEEIGSEYGMTELLSQAWSKGEGVFSTPPWMKIMTREYTDPLTLVENKTGGINVIDLANFNSCSFIATQDLGTVQGQQFELKGRFDNADIRGCNLLVD